VKEALAIDAETGIIFWCEALDKEMAVVRPAFQFDSLDRQPEKHAYIRCHMILASDWILLESSIGLEAATLLATKPTGHRDLNPTKRRLCKKHRR
jgi:hypothetical protein